MNDLETIEEKIQQYKNKLKQAEQFVECLEELIQEETRKKDEIKANELLASKNLKISSIVLIGSELYEIRGWYFCGEEMYCNCVRVKKCKTGYTQLSRTKNVTFSELIPRQ